MAIARHFTIGQLAQEALTPITTVRYYERIGLLVPDERSAGNYRLYGKASLRRLQFIRAAQSIGFTLDDVQTLLGAQHGKSPSCADVQGLITERLADTEQRLAGLRQVQRLLKSSLRKCQETSQAKCCHILEALEAKCLS